MSKKKVKTEETNQQNKPRYEEIVDQCFEDKKTHEETEDLLLAEGIESDVYGEYLDSKYKIIKDSEGANFLDGEGTSEETELQFKERLQTEEEEKKRKEIEEAEKQKQIELEKDEEDLHVLKKSYHLPTLLNKTANETEKPRPVKIREKAKNNAGTVSYTIWECPKCKKACNQVKGKWICSSTKCLYGKPKPLDDADIPREVKQYRLMLNDVNVALTNVILTYKGEGRFVIKEGQEDYISKQVIKTLNSKTWKQLNKHQIAFLAEFDKSKGFDA